MTSLLDNWEVIPATGIGQRMRADRPKQYLKLGDKTILEHTLDNLLSHPLVKGAVVIINKEDSLWTGLNYQNSKPIVICHGGDSRHQSVYNGLVELHATLNQDAHVLIHDAVRPFVQHCDIDRLIEISQSCDDGAILAAPVTDTLKLSDSNSVITGTQSRGGLWRALTPQAFRLSLIRQALDRVIECGFEVTDDASAMELMGYHPRLIDSDVRNIKITQPQDMELARSLFKQK